MSLSKPVATFCVLMNLSPAWAGGRACQLRSWADDAVSTDPAVSAAATVALREAGPEGLAALMERHAAILEAGREALAISDGARTDPAWKRLTAALDTVARARDAYASGLYWYTDWDQAQAAAKASGKPILSLRLLGHLDDEYSCANSRFFRTALYANAEVSRFLREHYVLHWKSVRPVPRMSIDFGDGRRMERTVTGNSIHYVVDAEGGIIDALPGLYGPAVFLRQLRTAEQLAQNVQRGEASRRQPSLRRYHARRSAELATAWNEDLARIGVAVPAATVGSTPADAPGAHQAARLTVSKMAVELPLVRASVATLQTLEGATDEQAWRRLAELHRGDAQLDETSLRFMREKSALLRQSAATQNPRAAATGCVPDMAAKFMDLMAMDTVRNEYLFHRQIHGWLAEATALPSVEALNHRVYAELFLTPDSDPWLGLLPADVYSGLANDGVAQAQRAGTEAIDSGR